MDLLKEELRRLKSSGHTRATAGETMSGLNADLTSSANHVVHDLSYLIIFMTFCIYKPKSLPLIAMQHI